MRHLRHYFHLASTRNNCHCRGGDLVTTTHWYYTTITGRSSTKYSSGIQGNCAGKSDFYFHRALRLRRLSNISGAVLHPPASEQHYQLYRNAVAQVIDSPEFKNRKEALLKEKRLTKEQFLRFEGWLLRKKKLPTDTLKPLKNWVDVRENWLDALHNNNDNCRHDTSGDDVSGTMKRKKLHSSFMSGLGTQRNALLMYIVKIRSPISDSESPPPPTSTPTDPIILSQPLVNMVQFVVHTLVDLCYEEKNKHLRRSIVPMTLQLMRESGAVIKKTKSRRMLNYATELSFMTSQLDRWKNQVALLEELTMYYEIVFGHDQQTLLGKSYLLLLKQLSSLRIRHSDSLPCTEFDKYVLVVASLIGIAAQLDSVSPSSVPALRNVLSNEFRNIYNSVGSEIDTKLLELEMSTNTPASNEAVTANELLADQVCTGTDTSVCNETKIQHVYEGTFTKAQRKTLFEDILSLGKQKSLTEQRKFAAWMK